MNHPNQHIAELGPLLEREGIRHVVIAPGSRNAPLIQLFTSSPVFHCYSIVDERSAAYVALGISRELGQPVAVVTTSGTAVMNLAPAIAEAFYQRIPLVILTADRPPEPIRQFTNQRIDQTAPFYNHTKGFFEMPTEPRSEDEVISSLAALGQLIQEALFDPPGPVHVNIPLLEPLYEPLPAPLFSDRLSVMFPGTGPELRDEGEAGEALLTEAGRVLFLAGSGQYPADAIERLTAWCRRHPAVVIAENLANFPGGGEVIGNPDLVLSGATDQELAALNPDLVVGMGGQVISKRLKNFLQSGSQPLTIQVEGDPGMWIRRNLNPELPGGEFRENDFLKAWKGLEERQLQKAGQLMAASPFSNLAVIAGILNSVPPETVVHLGNSSTVRYAQLLPVRRDLTYYSNRGTSGIDGSVSTAVGAAMVSTRLHLLVVGDLSFVYDSNALWNSRFPGNLRIVVINDGGGGIFRLLEGPERMDFFEEYSVTHHPVSVELLSQAFGRGVDRATGMEELQEKLEALFRPGSAVQVLEADTTGSENSLIFKAFNEKMK